DAAIIVTKIGYLEPTLYDVAAGWTLAHTPGPVDQDLARLGHQRIRRPMFPFDTFEAEPRLAATVLSAREVVAGVDRLSGWLPAGEAWGGRSRWRSRTSPGCASPRRSGWTGSSCAPPWRRAGRRCRWRWWSARWPPPCRCTC